MNLKNENCIIIFFFSKQVPVRRRPKFQAPSCGMISVLKNCKRKTVGAPHELLGRRQLPRMSTPCGSIAPSLLHLGLALTRAWPLPGTPLLLSSSRYRQITCKCTLPFMTSSLQKQSLSPSVLIIYGLFFFFLFLLTIFY